MGPAFQQFTANLSGFVTARQLAEQRAEVDAIMSKIHDAISILPTQISNAIAFGAEKKAVEQQSTVVKVSKPMTGAQIASTTQRSTAASQVMVPRRVDTKTAAQKANASDDDDFVMTFPDEPFESKKGKLNQSFSRHLSFCSFTQPDWWKENFIRGKPKLLETRSVKFHFSSDDDCLFIPTIIGEMSASTTVTKRTTARTPSELFDTLELSYDAFICDLFYR